MFVHCKTEIYRDQYPYADRVNPILHQFILNNSFAEDAHVPGTKQTPFDYKPLYNLKEFQSIVKFAKSIILDKERWGSDMMTWDLDLITWWGMLSNKGSYQNYHIHLPNHWSFVYYTNVPKRSSPLIFFPGNKKIHPKEGDMIIFPAYVRHKVSPNKCEGRTSLVGNFYWRTEYNITNTNAQYSRII